MNYEVVSLTYTMDAPTSPSQFDQKMTKEEFRERVIHLESEIKTMDGQIEPPLTHHFAPGMYGREMFLEKGACVVGRIHKHAHINVISRGRVRVVTEAGSKTLQAPCTFVSAPGTKRCISAYEDTIWTTVHATDETDLEAIEDEVIAPSYEALEIYNRLIEVN